MKSEKIFIEFPSNEIYMFNKTENVRGFMPFPVSNSHMCYSNEYVLCMLLPSYQVITVSGKDAANFLNRQFTKEVLNADYNRAFFSGYCSAKGKLLATLLFWKQRRIQKTEEIQILIRSDLLSSFIDRISIFILREDVIFTIQELQILGIIALKNSLTKLEEKIQSKLPCGVWELSESPIGIWISYPCADQEKLRWFWITKNQTCFPLYQSKNLHQSGVINEAENLWRGFDLALGLPWISKSIQNIFIPQAVNLDLVGGISFNKGCYPGQEVIARIHYRGALKRRMFHGLLSSSDPSWKFSDPLIGKDIIDGEKKNQTCGRIVDSLITPKSAEILFELNINSAASKKLCLEKKNGAFIQILNFPNEVKKEHSI